MTGMRDHLVNRMNRVSSFFKFLIITRQVARFKYNGAVSLIRIYGRVVARPIQMGDREAIAARIMALGAK